MNFPRLGLTALALAAQFLASPPAQAFAASPALPSWTVYDDLAAFQAATGATDATGPLPDLGFVRYNPVTVGRITYVPVSGSPMWMGPSGGSGVSDWTPLLPGNDVALDAREHLDLQADRPVYSMGFDFVEPSLYYKPGVGGCWDPVCTDSTFTVTLLDGASRSIGAFQFNAPDDVRAFVGVTASVPFSRLQIRETTGAGDDEYYGHVYLGDRQVLGAVPEPGAAWLLGAGLGTLAWLGRRRTGRDG